MGYRYNTFQNIQKQGRIAQGLRNNDLGNYVGRELQKRRRRTIVKMSLFDEIRQRLLARSKVT